MNANPVWSTACPDWERRIVARQSLITFDPLFPDEAEAALEVFKALRVVDLPKVYIEATDSYEHPTFGEVSEEWVFDFVRAVFGAYDASNAKRLIEEFFLLVSKKNGKSTIVAGIMLTALIRNWRHSAELLILAPTREVADNSFKPAADMARADNDLVDLLHVQDNLKQITHRLTNATLKVISADASTSAGKKAAFVLIEELWLFGKKNGASAMLQEATGGLISRPEGFVIYISTQSDAPPAGVFKEKLEYFRNVRDGLIDDPRSLPVLYEYPEKMVKAKDYLKPEHFYVTNPNIGKSVRLDWLSRKLANVMSGQDEEGDTIQTFLAKHLNVEIGMNLRANRWPGADFWAKRGDQAITLEYLYDHCDVIVPGLDGGGLDDLYGFAALGRHKATRDWLLWTHAWCHKGVLDRRKTIADRLRDFAKAGELTIVEDELDDISAIVEIIAEIKQRGLLAAVAVDPAGLGEMIEALDEIGVTQEEGLLVGAPQGYAMMNAIKTAERKLTNGTLKHSGSKLMSWCVSNLKIEPTATAIRATKQNAGDAKIDPVMALFDAVTVMSRNPEVKREKTYQMMFV
ncbi:terminase large subunit [Brucella anthropi]|uniref:Phage Terminase n=1 Tax=Brucella anthropi (strain ATCC 49188 / DSM 6882 / CCUG 24695 / JCM 21032 / LMG 3331 / NBRC 15819 / NCTC 12168 / Alc 37) TaxID=439375 RepID=A6WVG5_BRUA4|nr:terminase large subunit [Brucella anthropi]ABS12969.1 phage Terminase [Brucella anthropi ATCC 49188]QQC24777.1 terminase large subunit [Brucella anthropi]SUA60263.1 Phage terminase-like protein, large subunit [Brucella anthropi]